MTKNELKDGYKFTETFEGKVNVLVMVDGTFEGQKHYGKEEFIVAFDERPTEMDIKLWIMNHPFAWIMTDKRWTDLAYKYHILPTTTKLKKL